MKRLLHIVAVIALLLANVGVDTHSHCFGAGCGDAASHAVSASGHDHAGHSTDADNSAPCENCVEHHHHTAGLFPAIKPSHSITEFRVAYGQEAETLLPVRHYPPSKPPRA